MKFQEIENKNPKELREMLTQSRVKLGRFKFELANKSLKNVSQIGKTRKEIAQILTAVNRLKTKD